MTQVFAGAADSELACLASYGCSEEAAAASADSGSVCPICLNPFVADDILACLDCSHEHHHACLIEWLRLSATCPMCKCAYAPGARAGSHTEEGTVLVPREDDQDGLTESTWDDGLLAMPESSEREQTDGTQLPENSHVCSAPHHINRHGSGEG